jgi:ABC-type lipoprotein release transport system permease subunit
MYANVHEQTKEIAVLRAMGMTRFRLYRVYIYEAFTLVFSSSVLVRACVLVVRVVIDCAALVCREWLLVQ